MLRKDGPLHIMPFRESQHAVEGRQQRAVLQTGQHSTLDET